MEIFISGSQVCEKKNTFGLGAFSSACFQEPGSPCGTEFRPGSLLWWGKCLLARGLGSPSTALAPSGDMSWVWVRASQESHTPLLETSLGHPHLLHPHPTWDRRQVPLGKARCEGSSHFISFNTLRPFRPIFFLSCVTFFHS